MKSKVKDWILSERLIEPNDTIICAVSGGADSVAMFHVLWEFHEEMEFALEICHVNHQLRGVDAEEDALFVENIAHEFHIPIHIKTADIKKIATENKVSEETAGRMARYDFFDELTEKKPQRKVATAHTASDQAETMIFNLMRGTGIRGLSGIPSKRGGIIRPIRSVCREEVESFLLERNIPHREDESNASLLYTRNRIRHEVIPLLKDFQPDLENRLLETSQQFKSISLHLESEAENLETFAKISAHTFDCNKLRTVDSAIQTAFLRNLFENEDIYPDARAIHDCEVLFSKSGRTTLNNGKSAESVQGKFRISSSKVEEGLSFEIMGKEGKILLPDGRSLVFSKVSPYKIQSLKKVHLRPLKNWVDYGKMNGSFILRTRKPGDYFTPAGRGVSKTLKKLFNEAGLPQEKRQSCVIAENDEGIFWVEGFGVSQWVVPTENTAEIAEIFIEGEELREL